MIILRDIHQGSEQWEDIRRGRATASEFNKILTPAGEVSKQAVQYMRKLVRETVIDDPLEWIGNKYTDWGERMEAEARDVFTEHTGLPVEQVGFCLRGDEAPLGCSPDGLIPGDGSGPEWIAGVELKCPKADTHVGYLMEGVLPAEYRLQVHGSMAVTGLDRWWFMSYFPDLNPFILEVRRNRFTECVSASLDRFLVDYAKERERVLEAVIPQDPGDPEETANVADLEEPVI